MNQIVMGGTELLDSILIIGRVLYDFHSLEKVEPFASKMAQLATIPYGILTQILSTVSEYELSVLISVLGDIQ